LDPARRSPLARPGAGRLLVLASLILLAGLAWSYIWLLTSAMERGDMTQMGLPSMPMSMEQAMNPAPAPWTVTTFALMFAMWWVMMLGMMIPSALPMILLYERVQRHHLPATAAGRTALFSSGYLLAWGLFSLVATSLQWLLTTAGLLAPMSLAVGHTLGAVLFAAAGLYQLTPLKHACLRHCRSPADFLATHHRAGKAGALLGGAHHGLYCTGCCWLLMALLFAVGVMNIAWVAALAALVLIEKLAPVGHGLARASGIAMLAIAAWLAWLA
jgi:predicted metal-binding membrane protein